MTDTYHSEETNWQMPDFVAKLVKDQSKVSHYKDDTGYVVVAGVEDRALLEYVFRFAPEIWSDIETLRQEQNLVLDIKTCSAWRGLEILHEVHSGESAELVDNLSIIASFSKKQLTQHDLYSTYVSVILGAGKGTRMGNDDSQKVCTLVGTRTATERALEIYHRTGFTTNILVVGHGSSQVVKHVSEVCPQTTFVLQSRLLGTGHAARQAMYLLEKQGFKGNVLVVAGDKVIEPEALELLRREFEASDADLMALCTTKNRWPNSGRILLNAEGRIEAIIETIDIRKMQILESLFARTDSGGVLDAEEIRTWIWTEMPNEKKRRKAFPHAFLERLTESRPIDREQLLSFFNPSEMRIEYVTTTGDFVRLTGEEIEQSAKLVNVSVYLFKSEAFYFAVKRISNNNAQKEYYLTDIFEILCKARCEKGMQQFKVLPLELEDTEQVLGFNTEQELKDIMVYLRRKMVTLLEQRGVVVDESAKTSDVFWVDDLDSIAKIGKGTRILGDSVIDLGSDPRHTIGANCVINNAEVYRKSFPDGTVIG